MLSVAFQKAEEESITYVHTRRKRALLQRGHNDTRFINLTGEIISFFFAFSIGSQQPGLGAGG